MTDQDITNIFNSLTSDYTEDDWKAYENLKRQVQERTVYYLHQPDIHTCPNCATQLVLR